MSPLPRACTCLRRDLALLVCCTLSVGAMSGCVRDAREGYAFSGQRAPGVGTIRIPLFRNRTPYAGLEQQLTEAIIKQVQASTDLRVTTGPADSVLVGTITDVDMRRLSLREGTGLVQEVAVQMTIDFAWSKAGDKTPLVARTRFTTTDTFIPSRPSGERIELGQYATIDRLAKDVVREMRTSW